MNTSIANDRCSVMTQTDPKPGDRCRANESYTKGLSSQAAARNGRRPFNGTIVRRSEHAGCFVIQWDHLQTTKIIHRNYFDLVPALEERGDG